MAELTVDKTYGTALYEAARETGKTEQILEEAEGVLECFRQEEDLLKFVSYPAISATEKKTALQNIFEGNISDELLNFMFVLIDKRRMGEYEKIIRIYKDLVNQEEGVAYGTVVSAVPLSAAQIEELEAQTSQLLQETVRLVNETDPDLIAGVKILVNGKIIDASYRKRFDEMASQMNIS